MNLSKTFLIFILSTVYFSAHAAKIESEKEKLSYSMGIFFAQSVTQQNMDLDIPAFMVAIEDTLKGADLKLSTDEMQQILADYQKKEQDERTATATNNKQAGIKYLEENKNKEGVVSLESGLQYKILKAAEGKKPSAGSTVVVHYRGTLIDGTEFDSSYSRGQPAEFGVNRVIKGWQEAIQLMPVGSKWQIFVPSDLAYGERGAGNQIGPHATLLFDVELLEIK